MYLQKVIRKKIRNKIYFLLVTWRSLTKRAGHESGSGYVSQRYGPADPDSYQNATDPEHYKSVCCWALIVVIRSTFCSDLHTCDINFVIFYAGCDVGTRKKSPRAKGGPTGLHPQQTGLRSLQVHSGAAAEGAGSFNCQCQGTTFSTFYSLQNE